VCKNVLRYKICQSILFWLALFFCLPIQANDKTLRLYNWNDYIAPEVLASFNKETGIAVETSIYTSMEEMLSVVKSGVSFDILVPSHFVLPTLIDEKLLHPLDKTKLPNLSLLDRRLITNFSPFDSGYRYTAPYLWGTIGLAVNRTQVEARLGGEIPQSWDLLFNPAISSRLADCGISMLNAPNEMLTILLNYKGLNLKQSSTRRINQIAVPILRAVHPHLRYVDEERYIQDLAEGKLCLAVSLVGNALNAKRAGQPVDFFIPHEGSLMFLDALVIPANATNPEAAHQFINYIMRPEISAQLTETMLYGNFNVEAKQFLSEELSSDSILNPDASTLRRLYVLESLSKEREELRDEIWSNFIKGQ